MVVRTLARAILAEFLRSFRTFRQAYSGTKRRLWRPRLGLAIVRNLVELHGGTVTSESAVVRCCSIFNCLAAARGNSGALLS